MERKGAARIERGTRVARFRNRGTTRVDSISSDDEKECGLEDDEEQRGRRWRNDAIGKRPE